MALDSTVKVKFLGDAANLAREAARASKATDQVGKSAEAAHSHLSRMAKSFIAGASIGAAAIGIERFAKSTVDAYKNAAGEASKLSRLTGLAAEDASRLGFAAHETGVNMDDFTRAVGILSKNLNGADKAQTVLTKTHHLAVQQVPKLVKGHIEYAAHLVQVTDTQKKTVAGTKSLGFALRDATGHLRPMNELLPEIADKFKNMANGPEKTALALKLFGRNGAALLPFLNQGATGLAKFAEEADKLGITMSGKDVAAYRQYVAAQRSFKAAIEGVKISLGRELFPVFSAWTQSVAENGPMIASYARELGQKIAPAAMAAAREIRSLAKGFQAGQGAGGELRDTLKLVGEAIKLLGKFFSETQRTIEEFEYGILAVARGVLDVVGVLAKVSDKLLGTHLSDTIDRAITKIRALQAGIEASRAGATVPINVVITETHALNPATHAKGFIGPTVAEGLAKQGVAGPYTPQQTGAAQVAAAAAAATKEAADKVAKANKAALDKELATAAAAQKVADVKAAAADALQKATDKLKDALASRVDEAKGIRDSLVSSNSVVRDGVSWTAKDLLSRFTVTMAKVKRFQAAISALVHKGYDRSIIEQVAAAGVQGGMGTAIGLAHASSKQVGQFNATQRAIERSASRTGDRVAGTQGPIVNVYIDGKQIAASVILKHDRDLARGVNEWNARNGYNGHQLAS